MNKKPIYKLKEWIGVETNMSWGSVIHQAPWGIDVHDLITYSHPELTHSLSA